MTPHPTVNVLMVHGSESGKQSPGRVNMQTKGRAGGGGAVSRVKRMPGRAGRQRVSARCRSTAVSMTGKEAICFCSERAKTNSQTHREAGGGGNRKRGSGGGRRRPR